MFKLLCIFLAVTFLEKTQCSDQELNEAIILEGPFRPELPVSRQCLVCLCRAESECKPNVGCNGDVCGPFRITPTYWAHGARPSKKTENLDSAGAFERCAVDTFCAALAVQGYMTKFEEDCNGDGKIDCDDYALIHRFGGDECLGKKLPEDDWTMRYYQCHESGGKLD